nr:ribonuclease H-like domain-containing protein [Tanacetum cinerariifolium]
TNGQIRELPAKTTKEILAKERERKARTTLLIAIPEDHLVKFHKLTDAKEMWEAIKSRFGGNDESKKMQKYLLKQQFESFFVSNSEGLHKGYDRFQSLLSRLETHGAGFSTNDPNQKFFRSLPSSWSQVLLDHEDLEQDYKFDFEEMNLKWQVAMISTRLKKFYKKIERKLHFDANEPIRFVKSKVKCFNCHNTGYFARKCRSKGNKDSRRRDTRNTGYKARDNEKRPAKQDEHKAMVTIDGKSVDWTGHAKDDTEDYALITFNSSNSGSDTKKLKLLVEAEREKEELKTKLENFQSSSKVPPPMTGNYMPPKSDFGIDESKFTYGPKQSTTSESDAKTSDLDSCESSSSEETLEIMPKPVESKPKVVNEPKVWSDAPIIEEYESDSDDEYVSKASVEQEKPSCAFINIVKHVKTPRQTIQDQDTCSQNPKVDKRDWPGLKSKIMGLGYGYTKKACFVCGSFSHLIKDCDFHEKRMAKQVELNKDKNTLTCQRNDRLVWNNVQRLNHKNKFVPTAVLTKTGRFPVNVARQNFSSQTTSTNTVRKVNTARPIVNEIRPRHNVYKSHAPNRRPFNRTTTPKANFVQHKINTAGDKAVSAVRGKWETAVKASAGDVTGKQSPGRSPNDLCNCPSWIGLDNDLNG